MPRVTISDVAREAEVSTMTVSRVVNNKGEISPATRSRVERAIARLGYRPNRLARALSLQTSQTLGMVVPDINNPFFSEIIRGAEDEAWERGYALIISSTVESLEREARTLQLLEENHVDGVLVCSPRLPDEALFGLLRGHRAALLLNRSTPENLAGTLQVDDTHGAMRATHHLLGRGRRDIGMVAGPETSHSRRRRVAGYTTALETTGNEVVPSRIASCVPDEIGGYEATRALLQAHPNLSGLFCHNDLVAVGALQACRELGVRVPDDVAVVGCDDIRLASLVTPALTTLRVDKQALGRRAVALLLERLSAPDKPPLAPNIVKPELVVRESAP
jgi:LacI family transcriptional regulator